MSQSPEGRGELRKLMQGFIQERFQNKTEKLAPDDPKYLKLQEQFQYDTWIADAARRVGQLQVVTHSLKAIHPDAKGTNLYKPPSELSSHDLVSSACLQNSFDHDVVGNAAALDVYKFLRLEYEGRTLLDLALAEESGLIAALNDDPEQGLELCRAFAEITAAKGALASHTRAKQFYWLTGGDPTNDLDYHLLAPLYPTSLAHRLFKSINEERFGEAAKAARDAQRKGEYSERGYQAYPELAVQKLGGTKPQNISQLNSERGGNNYLLASLPPVWKPSRVAPLLKQENAFWRFNRRMMVRETSGSLINFLKVNPPANMHTRNDVDDYLDILLDELVMFTSEMRLLTPGWSDDPDCYLYDYQKQWLDPRHYQPDLGSVEPAMLTWPAEVMTAFAGWLNHKFRRASFPVGDPEFKSWMSRLDNKLTLLQEELPYV